MLGHRGPANTAAQWSDTWALVLAPIDAQTTRLVVRGLNENSSVFDWIFEPAISIMERGMLLGLKDRAERIR